MARADGTAHLMSEDGILGRKLGWNASTTRARRRIFGDRSTIGFLQWDGGQWVDQADPAFVANEEWEHGSVYEPNLVYHEGRWKMWYVAGSNHEDYLVHGYAESQDGRTRAGRNMRCLRPRK